MGCTKCTMDFIRMFYFAFLGHLNAAFVLLLECGSLRVNEIDCLNKG